MEPSERDKTRQDRTKLRGPGVILGLSERRRMQSQQATRPAAGSFCSRPGQDVMISSRESRGAPPKVYSWPQWRQRAQRRPILPSHLPPYSCFPGQLSTYSSLKTRPFSKTPSPRQQWIYSVLLFAGAAHSGVENDVGELGAGRRAPHRHPGTPETMGFVVMGNELACLAPWPIV